MRDSERAARFEAEAESARAGAEKYRAKGDTAEAGEIDKIADRYERNAAELRKAGR